VLSRVDSEVLIVRIFSFYDSVCQKEAPSVNALYAAVSANPEIRSRIKMCGIGAGNSSYEVNAFRDLLNIKFPLISDGDSRVSKILGEIQLPYFFVLVKRPGGMQVVYSRAGESKTPGLS